MMNPKLQNALRIVTIGGASVLVVGAASQLIASKFDMKKSVMPLVTILVGVAAFSYAMGGKPIQVLPKTEEKKA